MNQKLLRKVVSIFCVAVLFLTLLPVSVFAADTPNKCLQVVTGANQWNGTSITAANMGIEVGKKYTVSFKVYTPDVAVGLVLQTAKYAWVVSTGVYNPANKAWNELSGTLDTTTSTTLADFNLTVVKRGNSAGGQNETEVATYYIDDFKVVDQATGAVIFSESFDGPSHKFTGSGSSVSVVNDPQAPAPEPDPDENHVFKVITGINQWEGAQISSANLGLVYGGIYIFSVDIFTPDMEVGILVQHTSEWRHIINSSFTTPDVKEWRTITGTFDTNDVTELFNIQVVKAGGGPNEGENVTFYMDNFKVVDAVTGDVVYFEDFEGASTKMGNSGATTSVVSESVIYEIPPEEPIKGEYALDVPSLKDIYADYFMVGNIVNPSDFGSGTTARARYAILKHHFNALTFENSMKPDSMWGSSGYNVPANLPSFSIDQYIKTLTNDNFTLIGHTLAWHAQSPNWLTLSSGTRDGSGSNAPVYKTYEEAKANLKLYIETIAGHYYNNPDGLTVYSWDVLNEAINFWGTESAANRTTWQANVNGAASYMSPIYAAYENGGYGPDYVYDVFLFAREADPNAILYYNDYNMQNPGKATLVMNMVNDINARYASEYPDTDRLLIEGIGMQEHESVTTSLAEVEASIQKFISTGCVVSITELDVGVSGYTKGTPLSEEDEIRQALHYAKLFNLFKKYSDSIERVTFWGLDDGTSWRPNDICTIFDSKLNTKLAYYAIADPDAFIAKYSTDPVTPTEPLTATITYGTPIIGGEVADPIWDSTVPLFVDRHLQVNYGATGVAKVLWDEDYLYVRMTVSDLLLDKSSANVWEQDSIEIFFNETNSKSEEYADGMGQYRINFANEQSFNLGGATSSEGFESYATVISGGYVIEMKIPFQFHSPKNGDPIGFDAQINDANAKGARFDTIMWSDTTGMSYADGSNWGTLVLFGAGDLTAYLEAYNDVLTFSDGDFDAYTASSVEAAQDIITEALSMADSFELSAASDQTIIDAVTQALLDAIVEATSCLVEKADLSAYLEAYAGAAAFLEGDFSAYTTESLEAAQDIINGALAYADALELSDESEQGDIDVATQVLEDALAEANAALVKKPAAVTVTNASSLSFVTVLPKNANTSSIMYTIKITYSNGTTKIVVDSFDIPNTGATLSGTYQFASDHDLYGYGITYDIRNNGSTLKKFTLVKISVS